MEEGGGSHFLHRQGRDCHCLAPNYAALPALHWRQCLLALWVPGSRWSRKNVDLCPEALFPRHCNDCRSCCLGNALPCPHPCRAGQAGNCLGHCIVSLHSCPSHCLFTSLEGFGIYLSSWSRDPTVASHGRARTGEGGSGCWEEKQHWSPCSPLPSGTRQ